TIAEIAAAGGAALGIELDVCDHQAVESMVQRVVAEWGRVDVLVANAGGGRGRPVDTKASMLEPALLNLVTGMNFFGTVYSCNAVAPFMEPFGQDHYGQLGGRPIALSRRRLRPLRGCEGCDRALYTLSGSGAGSLRHQRKLHRSRRHRHWEDYAER